MATKFLEHFALIATASEDLWDEEAGFYHDVLHQAGGGRVPLRVRSVVGLLPLAATTTLGPATLERLPEFAVRLRWFTTNKPALAASLTHTHVRDGVEGRLLAVVPPERLARLLGAMLDEARVPLASRPARLVGRAPRPAVHGRPRRHAVLGRLRAGGVDHQPVRRQLELARPRVVPGQPPAHRGRAALRPVLRRRLHRGVPDGLGPDAHPRRRGRRAEPAAGGDVPRRRRRAPPGLRRRPSCCRPTRCSTTACCSTSTSTATPAPGSAHRTRPAGPGSSPS